MTTETKSYFMTLQIAYNDGEGERFNFTVPCIVESDESESRRGLFVWLMEHEHEHLNRTEPYFQDAFYEAICGAVFGVSLDTFLENGLIKAPSGSVWSQHVQPGRAYLLEQYVAP